jgi:hypothetical protein
MLKYELGKPDFDVLDKLMANVLGNRTVQVLTAAEIARIDYLKDKFAAAFSCTLETEE